MNGTHGVVSGYTISTCFRGLMGDQLTPGFWGVTLNASLIFFPYALKTCLFGTLTVTLEAIP